ncbi:MULTISPECIES: hypothetical protein [Bifidobacterium]|uniref:hypothetical protein n=1 Tax=Bifidobacterium TaxID=1678 RepID=UPI0005C6E6AE|nr:MULTISPECIES: hypothetical protein [Bifidobacterium]TPF77409.1 hypothetical protein BW09_09920 [Bifidobacterium sp. UTCIF-1]TPF79408.1 hypothetical protein BW08_10130 [Bifidobacterium sp. UTCIF-24]TPF81389.1 hypothetical protein BW12_10265 [Bifidobacterium sp. UTCIF-3]TPF91850.1 hypothetical protein BW14_11025 [Bifidobacterium sp. UTBIF-68]TPF83505.1 hypothetical protein BW07_09910 [Bifidobacterium sp. UTCIF-36]
MMNILFCILPEYAVINYKLWLLSAACRQSTSSGELLMHAVHVPPPIVWDGRQPSLHLESIDDERSL